MRFGLRWANTTDIYGLKPDRTELVKDRAFYNVDDPVSLIGMDHLLHLPSI